jgi:hypothetical protein
MWRILVGLGIVGWFAFGTPPGDVADWLWPDDAAPWETVDAFYYPNRSDLTRDVRKFDLDNVDGCRSWVNVQAHAHNDPWITQGDYECGVGYIESLGLGLRVYRTTVR